LRKLAPWPPVAFEATLINEVDRGFREFASMNPRWQRSREARATPDRTDREAFDRHVRRCGTPDLRLHLSGRQDLNLRPLDPQDVRAKLHAHRKRSASAGGGR
jgi:hypothetical protein